MINSVGRCIHVYLHTKKRIYANNTLIRIKRGTVEAGLVQNITFCDNCKT